MTTKRLAILLVVLLGGLSTTLLVPEAKFTPAGIELELPEAFGAWWGRPMAITQKEIDVLGPGTEFSRKEYGNGRGDAVLASIVLSGEDMMTSIHRPERCMRAQGWEFPPAIARVVDVPGHGKVPVMRLKNHKTERLKDGSTEAVENICYYWFAGYRDLTDSHLERVWFDTRDRVRTGMSQRWAMVMVAANITGLKKFGRDEAATDELLVDVVRQLAPRIHRETIAYH